MKSKYIALGAFLAIMITLVIVTPSRQERVDELEARYSVRHPSIPVPTDYEHPEIIHPEDYENLLIEQALLAKATVLEDCTITYYCCEKYPHICNAGPPYLTYLETKPTPWVTCAVDPRLIPLGSDVLIDLGDGELLYLVAEDIGGSIKGNKIDINVATHQEALELGVDQATVYYIPPEVNCNG